MTQGALRLLTVAGALAASAIVAASSAAASAAQLNGHQLAQRYCTQCHVIDTSGRKGWTNAPPFRDIANSDGASVASLSAFIEKPHARMVNDNRPADEATAIASYIMSLKSH